MFSFFRNIFKMGKVYVEMLTHAPIREVFLWD